MKKTRVITILLMLSVIISSSLVCAETVEMRYIGIEDIYVNLSINSAGQASCYARVNSSASNYTPAVSATLKRSSDGNTWTPVASWSSTGTFVAGASVDETVSVSKGFRYRLFVTARIHNHSGTLIETAYKNSRIVLYY